MTESIFDNRIEIINPSSFFGGLTVENTRWGKSKQPDHLMAEFCACSMNLIILKTSILSAVSALIKVVIRKLLEFEK